MLVALYKGVSLVSRTIRFFTRSEYSHAALVDPETGRTWEAWHNPGHFRALPHPLACHDQRTEIDYFAAVKMRPDIHKGIELQAEEWAGRAVRYDFRSIIRFATRRLRLDDSEDALFCSEAVALAFARAGLPLLNAPPSLITPGHLAWSTELVRVRPVWVPPNPT